MSLQRFQVNQACDFIAVTTDVRDLDSFIKLSGDAIERLVCLLFRERCSAPLKESDQRAPQILVFFTSLRLIFSQTLEQLGEGFCGQPRSHLPSMLLVHLLCKSAY